MLAAAGRLAEARALGEEALQGDLEPSVEAAILVGLGEAFKHAGQDTIVVRHAERALARRGLPPSLRARLLAVQAHALLYTNNLVAARRAGDEAMRVGTSAGDPSAVVFGAVAGSVVARRQGHLDRAVTLAGDAVALADREGGEARMRHPRLWLGRALISVDRFDEAEAALELGQREAQELGTAWSLPVTHGYRAQLWLAAGRLEDAVAEAEAGLAIADQLEAWALSAMLISTLGWLAICRNRMAEAQAYLSRLERPAERRGGTGDQFRWGWAVLQDARNRPVEAVRAMVGLYQKLNAEPGVFTQEPLSGPLMVRLALRAERPDLADLAVAGARALANANPTIASLSAAAAHAEGVRDDDLDALRVAVAGFRDTPRRLALASALEDAALAEEAAGDRDAAIALLDEALAGYDAAGTERDAARVLRRLRAIGVRRRRSRAVARSRTGWASLTPAELSVVRLVAVGMTNRATAAQLFLSPHTVDSHLRHAFGKLGVTSRVELARRVLAEDGDRIT
jgi:DNA-binding CsgD family transcriptional regulator